MRTGRCTGRQFRRAPLPPVSLVVISYKQRETVPKDRLPTPDIWLATAGTYYRNSQMLTSIARKPRTAVSSRITKLWRVLLNP